jgi:hypothetical protein
MSRNHNKGNNSNSPESSTFFLSYNAKKFSKAKTDADITSPQVEAQFKRTFDGFFAEPLSMKELSVRTGIDRAGICWFCRKMRLTNTIAVFKKGYCGITKRLVNKYTTNPDLFPSNSPQLNLF